MNTTVKRIVDLLFEKGTETEESKALHEELLNNCQEHFEDLVAGGLSEDEAIGEIVRSLKGMDDVIAAAQKRENGTETKDRNANSEADKKNDMVFPVDMVREVNAESTCQDFNIGLSTDGSIHVINLLDENNRVDCHAENGILTIRVIRKDQEDDNRSFFHADDKGNFSFNFQSLGAFIRRNIHINVSDSQGEVKILLPEDGIGNIRVNSRSGDIRLSGIHVPGIVLRSVSGDVCAEYDEAFTAERVELNSNSGDVTLKGNAGEALMNSLSGDVSAHGNIRRQRMKSTSGDVTTEGAGEELAVSSVSGDVTVRSINGFRSAQVTTISGDAEVKLPQGYPVTLYTKTVSGDIRNECVSLPDAASSLSISTVSGDIKVF